MESQMHGTSKRRTWRKLHLGVDPDSKEIIVAGVTSNSIGSGDSQIREEVAAKGTKKCKEDIWRWSLDRISAGNSEEGSRTNDSTTKRCNSPLRISG